MKKKAFKIKKPVIILNNDKGKVLKFPQISRFFTAKLFYDFFIVFLAITSLSIVAFNYLYPLNTYEKAKINLFLRPYDSTSYLALSDIYLGYNDYEKAKRELKTAIFFSNNEAQKIEATQRVLMIERAERTRVEIEAEIIKWEGISKAKPNYRDAFFRLAVLNYQIFKNGAAKEYLKQAMALDPNFEEGKRLGELL